MTEQKFEFGWSEEVVIDDGAPAKFNPTKVGFVVEMRLIENEQHAAAAGLPVGTVLYRVEFLNGSIVEMPGEFIRHRYV